LFKESFLVYILCDSKSYIIFWLIFPVSGSCDKKSGFLVEENPNKTEVSVLKSCIFISPKSEKGRVEKRS